MNNIKKTVTILIIAITVLTAGVVFNFMIRSHFDPEALNGTYFLEPRDIGTFTLTDNRGKRFTQDHLLGHWSLIFFGFTHCPMICPTTMTELANTYQMLEQQHIKQRPTVIMVSVDPERDTVARMNEYVTSFNKTFIGLTGDKKEIDSFAKHLSVLYLKVDSNEDNGNYNIDHSGSVMLIDPQGKLHALFSYPHDAEDIVADYKTIISVA